MSYLSKAFNHNHAHYVVLDFNYKRSYNIGRQVEESMAVFDIYHQLDSP